MIPIQLNQAELKALRLAHRSCRDKRSAYRLNAVILLGSGWTVQEVTDALLIDDGTLRKYVSDYQTGGIDQLLATHYQGGLSYLSDQEKQTFTAHLGDHTYSTTQGVIRYVAKQYGVTYSVSGVTDLLHTLGFSYKKPKVVPGKADRDSQEAFIVTYRELEETKGKEDPIYFVDGVHPQHNTQAGYGWIKRGEEKAIPSNSGRERLNINGALNIDEMKVSIVMGESVNADSTIELLKQLVRNCYYETFAEFRESCESFFTDIGQHKEALSSLLTENFHLFSPTAKIRKTYP